ncbi:hypothetical protein BDW71DRAFT_176076 [Aspergillus fruticulosus]
MSLALHQIINHVKGWKRDSAVRSARPVPPWQLGSYTYKGAGMGWSQRRSLCWLVLVLCHVGNYLTRISRRRDLSNNPIVHAASPRSVGPGCTLEFD